VEEESTLILTAPPDASDLLDSINSKNMVYYKWMAVSGSVSFPERPVKDLLQFSCRRAQRRTRPQDVLTRGKGMKEKQRGGMVRRLERGKASVMDSPSLYLYKEWRLAIIVSYYFDGKFVTSGLDKSFDPDYSIYVAMRKLVIHCRPSSLRELQK
jgi:hypothetical protein